MIRHRFHAICPYFAMFPETFVRKYLVWSRPGDLVFDPFSGRGTTAFESLLNDRRAAACDTNPVAVCISRAKTDPPGIEEALTRVTEIENTMVEPNSTLSEDEFFQTCFHPDTLEQLLHFRRVSDWRHSRTDCFLSAIALGCLHGESHRSPRYFSNRMPRTISTKPAYSVRWWHSNHWVAPRRDIFAIMRDEICYRFVSAPATRIGHVQQCDARQAADQFSDLQGEVSLVITSPPYLDTTNFLEDQWLRVWFLGGEERPTRIKSSDDRHSSLLKYWQFLTEVWTGIAPLLRPNAQFVVRLGGTRATFQDCCGRLLASLTAGLNRRVTLLESHESDIVGGQLHSFMPKAKGTKAEFDYRVGLA